MFCSCQYCFFCGASPICLNAEITESGVQLAKYNVESAFAMVGVTSQLEVSVGHFAVSPILNDSVILGLDSFEWSPDEVRRDPMNSNSFAMC